MIAALIFVLHLVFILYVFLKYKKESIGEGFLSIAFVGVIFAVGWTIATILTNTLFGFKWFEQWYWQALDSWMLLLLRKEFNRDVISLLILSAGEFFFYYKFFMDKKGTGSKDTDTPSNPPTSA